MSSPVDPLEHLDLPSVSDSSDTEEFLQELAALNDAGLLRATVESLECGRLTPLIKEELRCRIQSRRLSEGKEELLVEFPSPTPTQPRPDEVEKRDRRREQNRRAAQKFRKRKKERGDHLIEETQRLETHNTTLMSEIRQLNDEKNQLARIIQSHASICPLTPRQSPLTVIRESPIPHPIRESPLPTLPPPPPPPPPPQPSPSFSNLPISSPVRKSPMLIQQSAGVSSCTCGASSSSSNNTATAIHPMGGNTRAVILLPPSGESSTGMPTHSGRLLMASPIHMSGRPRKSPVPRVNQSPVTVPGERSPVPLGSPRKQNKHANSLKLNLPGPKPVKPILPKGSLAIIQSCTSPKTPLGIITSPLPVAHSPVSFVGRGSIHQSPVFFNEDCFNASHRGGNQFPIQSPVSFTDSNSTPGHQVTQSPVFFAEKSPGLGNSCHHFFQPSSASSSSSTSSLASLLRQESPSSVLSNSSVLSTASSVFFSNSGSFSSNTNNSSNNNNACNNSSNNNNSTQNMIVDDQSNLSAFLPSNDAKSSSMNEINRASRIANWDSKSQSVNNQTPLNESNHFLHKSSTQLRTNSTENNKYGDMTNNSPNLRSLLENRKSTGSILEQALTRQNNVSFANRYRTPPSLTPTPTDFPGTFPGNMDNSINMGSLDGSYESLGGASGGDGCLLQNQQQHQQHQHHPQQHSCPTRNQQGGFSTTGLLQQLASMNQTPSSSSPLPASSSFPQSNSLFATGGDDNVLSVEDIERSVSEPAEAVDPLLDFIDIQELLELSSFHSPNSNNGGNSNSANNNSNDNTSDNSNLSTSISCNDILNANFFSGNNNANNSSGAIQGSAAAAASTGNLGNYFGEIGGNSINVVRDNSMRSGNSGGAM